MVEKKAGPGYVELCRTYFEVEVVAVETEKVFFSHGKVGDRVPTHLENLENSWNFVNLENSWNFMLDLEFLYTII